MSANNSAGYTFFIEPITITQNTQLVAIPVNNLENIQTYDYLLNVNVAPLMGSLNNIFLNASYVWYPTNNTVGINFTLNNPFVQSVLTANYTDIAPGFTVSSLRFAGQEFTSAPEAIAMKLKEVMAVKIFGSAGAVSAFTNSTYNGFSSDTPSLIVNGLNTAFVSNDAQEYQLFNQYVASGRFTQDQENDANDGNNEAPPQWFPFNFQNAVIDVQLTLAGSVQDSSSRVINVDSYPTVHYPSTDIIGGYNIPSNGIYRIPLLLKLHD